MDLETLTNMFPSHKLVMDEQFAQENISALKIKSVLNWSDTIFVNCDFSEAQFHLLLVSGAIFFKCDFSGAVFRACDIDGSEFISCNLTCADLQGAAVSDTTFTDCIIGGIQAPLDHKHAAFFFPRYSRNLPLISQAPYYVVSTADEMIYLFRTENAWRIHGASKQFIVRDGDDKEIPEPYRTAQKTAAALDQQKLDAIRISPMPVA